MQQPGLRHTSREQGLHILTSKQEELKDSKSPTLSCIMLASKASLKQDDSS